MKRLKHTFIATLLAGSVFIYYLNSIDIENTKCVDDTKGHTPRHHVTMGIARSADSTDWISTMRRDINIFLYSAFYDERILRGRLPVPHVVVIGVWHRINDPMYCAFWAEGNELLHVSVAQVIAIGGNKPPRSNATFVMHCPLSDRDKNRPNFISIDRDKILAQATDSAKIPVEMPSKPQYKMNFAICLKSVYEIPGGFQIPTQHLIEWIELNKLLGIEHIYVYNHSMGADHSKIFSYYAMKQFVDIFSHSNIPGYDVGKDPVPALIASSNDCLFRFMYSVRKIVHIDTDEIIAPFELNSLRKLLSYISRQEHVPVQGTLFQFSNQRYYLDDPRVKPGPLFSQFAVRHVAPEAPDVRPKSIVDPTSCLSLNSHSCQSSVPGASVIRVPTDIAASLHYKACSTSRIQNKPSNCSAAFEHSVEDLSMRKFYNQLQHNINRVLVELQNL